MKRLLCIIDSLNVGGAETFLMKILRCLSPDEYQFDFVVSKAEGVYSQEVLERGGRIYTIPPRRTDLLRALKDIRNIVKQNRYCYVIRLGDDPIVGLDLLAAKLGGAKRLAFRSCNSLIDLPLKMKIINGMFRPVLNHIANVKIAPSSLAAEFTFGKRYLHGVHILHNGVDLKKFRYDAHGRDVIREEFGIENKFVVGHIGRFDKQKNHLYLLKIFYEISKKYDNAVLIMVGSGADKDLISKWISDFGIENKVIMAGQRFDIPQLLSAMDVFVFPSLHEGMPNTVIEAQATGLPCVIADTITPEADITGLVHYLSLSSSASKWAKTAVEMACSHRKDTTADFLKYRYDIESVANDFISLIGMNEDTI